MITTLIFDFGDVFINLDKQGAIQNALELFQLDAFEEDMLQINTSYEIGSITTSEFINFYTSKFPNITNTQIIEAWNYIIKDFPKYRLDWVKALSQQNSYELILLSNTNDMHIDYIKNHVTFYDEFKACFKKFYLSHEIHLRKPNATIFEFVLKDNQLNANQCLFIDDTKANTDMAEQLGIHTWHIDETKEDVITLFKTKNHLF